MGKTGPGGVSTFTDASDFLSGSADIVYTEAKAFLDALKDLKAIDFSSVGDLPNFNSVVWLGSTAGVLDGKPVKPVVDTDIATLLAQLAQLVAPSAPTESFSYLEPGYGSQLRQPMIDKLLSELVNGGYGIDSADEIALFSRARDREAMLTQAAVDEVRRRAAASSFPMPQGSLAAAISRAVQEQMAKNSSVNRDIALKRADLFVEARRQVIDQVLKSEDQSIALYNAIQERTVRVGQIKVQMAIAIFDASIKLFMTQIQSLTDQIQGKLQGALAQVQIYATDAQAYSAFVNAIVSGAHVDIANSRSVMTRDIAAHQSKVDVIKFRLQQLMATVENSKNINSFATEFLRTGFGAAINGVNGLAVQSGDV